MKNTNQLIPIIILMLFPFVGMAQQDPLYSMYMFDKAIINPAYTGSSDWAVGTVKYRSQYSGIEGGPKTQTINFHTPITKRHVGVGFKVVNDQIAIIKNLNASVFYSYHLNMAGGKLSVGLEGGIMNRKIDYSDLKLSAEHDNSIPASSTGSVVPDFSIGFYYQKKQFYAGYSRTHLIKSNFKDDANSASQSHLYGQNYFMSGIVIDLNKMLSVEPNILLKQMAAAPVQLDINTMLYFKDKIGAGVQYRTGDAFVTLFKLNITESLRLAYSYDLALSGLSGGPSHEILVSYGIKLPPPPSQKEVHPRYYF